jgi:hypothetical protein
MLYPSEKFYRSILYFTRQITPSGIDVTDGQSYGVRMEDPDGKVPSVTVTITNTEDQSLELGSVGTSYFAVFTISAKSRMQRDALKDVVHSGILFNQVPIYSDFNDFVPTSGAIVEKYAAIGDYFQIKDMPNFDSDREKFFWNAVAFVTLDVLGL